MVWLQAKSARLAGIRKAAKSPLRKVVVQAGALRPPGVPAGYDMLECGHVIAPAYDLYGPRSPARRRCAKCLAGDARDFGP